jgi:hypothetical protein
MTVDGSVHPEQRGSEWDSARSAYYDSPKQKTTEESTPESVFNILDRIESEVLPRLANKRENEEKVLMAELERLSIENARILSEIAEREDVVRALFRQYSDLKADYAEHCKREIARAKTWTPRQETDSYASESRSWGSWDRRRNDWTKDSTKKVEASVFKKPSSNWDKSYYASSGWGRKQENYTKSREHSVEDDAFKPRWSNKPSEDPCKSYDTRSESATKKWWEQSENKAPEPTESTEYWDRKKESWGNSYSDDKKSSWYDSDNSYRKHHYNRGDYADERWERKWEQDSPNPSLTEQSSISWNRSSYLTTETPVPASNGCEDEKPVRPTYRSSPVSDLDPVYENGALPPHLASRLKIRTELHQNTRPDRPIPPPPSSAPSLRVDNNGWGYSGAFQ